MQKLTINEELKTLLPPLSDKEFASLEEDILKDGCLSPLIVWNEMLIDGHHRYEICMKHQIPFAVKSVVLDNMDDAKLWIWRHQDDRRNLSPFQRSELAMKFEGVLAARAKERQGKRNDLDESNIVANLPQCKKTRQELADIAGVGGRTLDKAKYIAKHADEDTKTKLRSGEKGVSIDGVYNQLRKEAKQDESKSKPAKKKPNPKNATITASETSENAITEPSGERPTAIGSHWKGVKEQETHICGVRFEPDPDDDYYDWITREEREQLREEQANSPAIKLTPLIRNYTIQSIPEHDPQYLVSCLFSLFSPLYRKKLLLALADKMHDKGETEALQELIASLQAKFQSQ